MGGAVGLAVPGFHEAAFLQALEHVERAIAEDMAFAGEAGDALDFAVVMAFKMDRATACEYVQRALFEFGDIQLSGLSEKCQPKSHPAHRAGVFQT